jgi:hypothetical protein
MSGVQPVEYRGIRISAEHVALLEGGRPPVSLPVRDVRRMTLEYGFTAERPLMEAILGIVLCALGALASIRVLMWLRDGGTIRDLQILLAVLIPIGIWLLRNALHRGHFLRIHMENDVRKLPFDGRLDMEFSNFVRNVEALTHLEIDREDVRAAAHAPAPG